jgi:enterochelin esterase family protein
MNPRSSFCLALLLALLCPAREYAQQPPAGKKVALLVGVRKYKKEELSDLKFTENDVNDLAALLRQNGYRRVVVLTQKNGANNPDLLPTGDNIREYLQTTLKNCQPEDTVLLSFSGHGVQFKEEKEHYFCPMDTRLGDRKTLVSLSGVYEQLKQCKAGTKVLFVDACRNDPEPEGGRFAAKVERVAGQRVAPPGGMAAFYSCSKGETSFESEAIKHGVFFHFVIEGLKGKAASKKGEVTLEALAAYVKNNVDDYVRDQISPKHAQTPHLVSDIRGQVPLVTGVKPPEGPEPTGNEETLGPDSQIHPGVPRGKVTKYTWKSKVFADTERDYWVYVPAQYDGKKPSCVMVFQDGLPHLSDTGPLRVPLVFDNLIHKKELPVIIGIFINPGTLPPEKPGDRPRQNRTFEFDTLSDQYARFLETEILPEVGKHYKLRQDAAGRAISGISSGGICAFTAAWQRPDLFSKVLCHIGSFVNIRGGHEYPSLIRKTKPPKHIRVFLQAGAKGLDNEYGSWARANQEMADALKFAKYDYQFVLGPGAHNPRHGGAILPDSLRWLWRDEK